MCLLVAARIQCTVGATCWRGLRYRNCRQAESKLVSVFTVTVTDRQTDRQTGGRVDQLNVECV